MSSLWINTGATPPVVNGEMSVKRAINNSEIELFKVNDADLKSFFSGWGKKTPDETWIAPPATPFGEELFNKYNHTPVNMNLSFRRGTVEKTTPTPEIVRTAKLINNSSRTGIFHTDISVVKSQSVSFSYHSGSTFKVGAKVGVQCKIVTAEASFEFSYSWGEENSQTSAVTLGSTSGVSVELAPRQAVEVSLISQKIVSTAKVVYSASLSDYFTVKYNDKYNYNGGDDFHHIWFITIPPLTQEITENIVIESYGESEIRIRDLATNQELDNSSILVDNCAIPGD